MPDNVERQNQLLTLTHETQNPRGWKDHIVRHLCFLHDFAIDARCKLDSFTVLEDVWADKDRSHGTKFVERLSVIELTSILFWHLENTTREIVAGCVA